MKNSNTKFQKLKKTLCSSNLDLTKGNGFTSVFSFFPPVSGSYNSDPRGSGFQTRPFKGNYLIRIISNKLQCTLIGGNARAYSQNGWGKSPSTVISKTVSVYGAITSGRQKKINFMRVVARCRETKTKCYYFSIIAALPIYEYVRSIDK